VVDALIHSRRSVTACKQNSSKASVSVSAMLTNRHEATSITVYLMGLVVFHAPPLRTASSAMLQTEAQATV